MVGLTKVQALKNSHRKFPVQDLSESAYGEGKTIKVGWKVRGTPPNRIDEYALATKKIEDDALKLATQKTICDSTMACMTCETKKEEAEIEASLFFQVLSSLMEAFFIYSLIDFVTSVSTTTRIRGKQVYKTLTAEKYVYR
eukprot:Awhi_evm1s551